jgi:hypothetical protein
VIEDAVINSYSRWLVVPQFKNGAFEKFDGLGNNSALLGWSE